MSGNDIAALLGCCCCCEDEPGRLEGGSLPERRARPAQPAPGQPEKVPDMPPVRRYPPLDGPGVPAIPSFDTPQRPGLWLPEGRMHLPGTDEQGIFQGESTSNESYWSAPDLIGDLVLWSGRVIQRPEGAFKVDHDAGTVTTLQLRHTTAPKLEPSAVDMPHTQQRRAERYPYLDYQDAEGVWRKQTRWRYWGNEVGVRERPVGTNDTIAVDTVQSFDGGVQEVTLNTASRTVTAYDFGWEVPLIPTDPSIYRRWEYVGASETTRVCSPPPSGVESFRVLEIQTSRTGAAVSSVETVVQGHIRDVWLSGYLEVGQSMIDTDRYHEVTAVYEREDTKGTAGYRSRVDVWYPIAQLTQQTDGETLGDVEYTEDKSFPADDRYIYPLVPVGRILRSAPIYGVTLRDVILGKAPPLFEPGEEIRFRAGDVTVRGHRNEWPGALDDPDGTPSATLSAFGREFSGGTWAACRDTPVQREDGTFDYSPLIVLHASQDTVTAIRPGGQVETCSRGTFEREVLRVPVGSFLGFSSVGATAHSWPPEWAWAKCVDGCRAVTSHDAWRDSYRADPPPDSPDHWTWQARPAQRPRKQPQTAPRGPLGLTLADVTDRVVADEALPQGRGPVVPPVAARRGETNVLKRVAKRLPYRPARIPDERDDRTGVREQVWVTFPPPPEGEYTRLTALYLRYRGEEKNIIVNGATVPLIKLGHNAAERRGWHPYVAEVPPSNAYLLKFRGQISLIGLIDRLIPKGGGGAT